MPTGRSIVSTCPARAALAGNPSDGYGGAVVAVPIRDLAAFASVDPADSFSVRATDPDLKRLLSATADAYAASIAPLDRGTLSATSTIPRSVGLAGSSALIIASLRVLAETTGYRFEPIELAEMALAVERERMGVEAGLQDRLVQSVGEPVAMEFDPVGFSVLDVPRGLPMFVAWSDDESETSDTVHRSLRRRFDAGDVHVRTSMTGLADQARSAAAAIERGDLPALAATINRTFEIRALMVDIDLVTLALADVGRRAGAAVNSAGSGGSVIGLAPTRAHVERIVEAFETAGYEALDLT